MRKLLILLALCLALTGCGDTRQVRREIVNSGDLTEAQVGHAMSLVSNYFAWHFEGCTLLELRYDAEATQKAEAAREEELGSQVIILHSTFRTDHRGGDGSLNPDSTYEGWQWILRKNALGLWDLEDWGY